MALIIFYLLNDPNLEIALISYIVVIVGCLASAFFLWQIDEVKLTTVCNEKTVLLREQLNEQQKKSIYDSVTEFSEDDDLNIIKSKRVNAVVNTESRARQ